MFDRAAAEDPQQGHQLVVWSCNRIFSKKIKTTDQRQSTDQR
jgi:hypothetical protein